MVRSPFRRTMLVQPLSPPTIQIKPSREKQADSRDAQRASGPSASTTPATKYIPGKWDIFTLGITIVIGGQYFGWNGGINAGIYSFFTGFILLSSAYTTLCCCTAEITGALPFAGGSYGLARCTLGFYPAFMVGCCEALEYIAYVSASVISFVDLILDSDPSLQSLSPLLWALFYASALCIQIKGGRVFWVFNLGIGVLSLVIVVIYCLGSLAYVDFAEYGAVPNLEFVDGFHGFMKSLPLAAWFFVGVEALSLSSDQVDQPKKIIPVAQVSCVLTLFTSGLVVYFVTASLPPGLATLPTELVPFNRGFKLMFKLSHHAATVLSLPATYATAFGFMWCYGKLIVAMAMSRLLPKFLSKTTKENETPYGALLAGSAVSYILCIISYFVPAVGTHLFRICILSGFMSYTGQCIGYISLKRNYRNIKSSEFQSPFGIAGAAYSMMIWILAIIALVAFQDNGGVEVIAFGVTVVTLTVFYYGYSRKRQTFSAAENRVMLVAHVTKFNARKVAAGRNKVKKLSSNSKHTGGTETSQTETNGKWGLVSAKLVVRSNNAR
ncbi:putative amino acid permease YfnA [Phytophthora cinnamomi]|uniref:putative amino acid permease YfnA n=1 Tax=Phytophthora cinnamomi TaxID=4785 RepID=UPI00355A3945|nr:putative amino acid permease YfnA [Phytophthora cinnamomi]